MYYLRGNYVVLLPCASGVPMRFKYFRRPGFVVADGYSEMTGLSGATATVTSTTGMATGDFDLVSDTAPYGLLVSAVAGTVAGGTTVTMTLTTAQAAIFTANAGESYLIASGDAPGPQISQDLYSLLEQRTTWRALLAKKDLTGGQAQLAECVRTEAKIVAAMNRRTDGLDSRVVDRKFRRGRRNGWWGSGGVGRS